jgi:hypothetical protein
MRVTCSTFISARAAESFCIHRVTVCIARVILVTPHVVKLNTLRACVEGRIAARWPVAAARHRLVKGPQPRLRQSWRLFLRRSPGGRPDMNDREKSPEMTRKRGPKKRTEKRTQEDRQEDNQEEVNGVLEKPFEEGQGGCNCDLVPRQCLPLVFLVTAVYICASCERTSPRCFFYELTRCLRFQ